MYNELIKKDYTISLYERISSDDYFLEDGLEDLVEKQKYFKEVKIIDICSNGQKTPIMAATPKITRDINGKNTLTFTMYGKYLDYKSGEYKENPLIELIKNDSLIKLKYDNKVFDLLVTKIDKSSDNLTYNYTAEDQYIIELGKNGLSAEYSVELENNMGTIQELAKDVLRETDWRVAPIPESGEEAPFYSELIYALQEEPLYKCKLSSTIEIERKTDYIPNELYSCLKSEDPKYIQANQIVYLFYSDITNQRENFTILYEPKLSTDIKRLSADNLILSSYNYKVKSKGYTVPDYLGKDIIFDELPKIKYGEREEDPVLDVPYAFSESEMIAPIGEHYIEFRMNQDNKYYIYTGRLSEISSYEDFIYLDEITNFDELFIEDIIYYKIGDIFYQDGFPNFVDFIEDESPVLCEYRGARVVESTLMRYDENLERAVTIYEKVPNDNVEYYGYTETDYISPLLAQNYISDSSNAVELKNNSWSGISTSSQKSVGNIEIKQCKDVMEAPYVTYLECTNEVLNKGLQGYRSNIKRILPSETYILAFLIKTTGYKENITLDNNYYNGTEIQGAFYSYSDTVGHVDCYKDSNRIEKGNFLSETFQYNENKTFTIEDISNTTRIKEYAYIEIDPSYEIQDFTDNLEISCGLIFDFGGSSKEVYDVQFFKKQVDEEGKIIYPGRVPEDNEKLQKLYYYIYKDDEFGNPKLIHTEEETLTGYKPKLREDCEKISSITGKEQNYYNHIQNLTKNFECWADYKIARDDNGEMDYEVEYWDQITRQQVEYTDNIESPTIGKFTVIEEQIEEQLKKQLKIAVDKTYYLWNRVEINSISDIEDASQIGYYYETQTGFFYYYDGTESSKIATKVVSEFDFKNIDGFIDDDFDPLLTHWEKEKIEKYSSNYYYLIKKINGDIELSFAFKISSHYDGQSNVEWEDASNRIYAINRPKKYVVFKNYVNSQPNYAGFKYAVNLKSIQRTEDATQFSTKVVVKDSPNEFAPGGLSSIAKASLNPNKDNYILNFDYFLRQGFIDREELINDLYEKKGFYSQIALLNSENEKITEEYVSMTTTLDKLEADYTSYYLAAEAAVETKNSYLSKIRNCGDYLPDNILEDWHYNGISGFIEEGQTGEHHWHNWDTDSTITPIIGDLYKVINDQSDDASYIKGHFYLYTSDGYIAYNNKEDYKDNTVLYTYIEKMEEQVLKFNIYKPLADRADYSYREYKKQAEEKLARSKELIGEKRGLEQKFYKKYFSFIRESNWTSQDYIDDNLYYLDADAALRESAFPKISYNIAVVDISKFENYDCFAFDLGDYTYVEDAEFFGYDVHGLPAKEWVIVTQIVEDLDSPENNSIMVQNYKSELQDLFSRLTASTQTLDLNKADYNRAASILNPDGTVNAEMLQQSLNTAILSLTDFAGGDGITWTVDGLTIKDPTDSTKITYINGGRIYVSNDGGETKTVAIEPDGINGSALRIGSIDTSKVVITNDKIPTFLWDTYGISAYKFETEGVGENARVVSVDSNVFTRMDQFGFYGRTAKFENEPKYSSDITQSDNTIFYLGWDGFVFNGTGSGNVKTRIDGTGISIKNSDDESLFGVDSDGNVFVKGDLTGSSGRFGAVTIDDSGIYSENFEIDNTGAAILTSGTIGNIKINADQSLPGISSDNYDLEEGTGFYLDSANGVLHAKQVVVSGDVSSDNIGVCGVLKRCPGGTWDPSNVEECGKKVMIFIKNQDKIIYTFTTVIASSWLTVGYIYRMYFDENEGETIDESSAIAHYDTRTSRIQDPTITKSYFEWKASPAVDQLLYVNIAANVL